MEAAPNGEAALAAIRRSLPDLVLADVMMPRLDGFGLLRALCADERTRSIPVMLLSARAGEESRIEGMGAGADDYLVKPFSTRELLARVAAHLKISRMRAESEAELKLRIAEREALLKEVHHRVKNNLHVITSMLEIQARRTDDFGASRQLEEASNRVASIAEIHEILYQSGSFAGVDLIAYAAKLLPHLVQFYNMGDRIRIAMEGEPVSIDLERAVPCGLVLNELVSNTCKHAFPDGGRGCLTVRLALERQQIRLTVQDSGIGLPADFDLARSDSFGLTIVRLLANQLGGSVTLRGGAGTCAEVQFPVSKETSTRTA